MKTLFAMLLLLAGIALGLYVGVYLMFIGGIVDIINQIKAPEISAMAVAWGVIKIVMASSVGWLTAIILLFPAWEMLQD